MNRPAWEERQRRIESSVLRTIHNSVVKPKDHEERKGIDWEIVCEYANLVLAVFCIGMILMGCPVAHADTIPDDKAVKAIIGEAEGEGYDGMKAIACAIRNRGTLKGVYGLHANRVVKHLYSEDVEAKAIVAWATSADPKECGYLGGASYWGSTIVDKAWIAKMKQSGYTHTLTVKNTSFWRST